MSEYTNLTTKISSSLKTALLSADKDCGAEDMPGLSQFDINNIVEGIMVSVEAIETSVEIVTIDTISSSVENEEINISEVEADAETDEVSSYSRSAGRIGIPGWSTIVYTTSSQNYDSIFSTAETSDEVQKVDLESESVVAEVTSGSAESELELITEDAVETEEAIETEDAVETEDATETEDADSQIESDPPLNAKTEEELWIEDTGFGIGDIDVVGADNELDYFELMEEPASLEPVFENRQKIQEDQVVLVVEQLVVNPNQATTVVQGGQPAGGSAPMQVSPIISTPQQPQTVFYAPPTMPSAPVAMPQDTAIAPVMPPMAPAAPQRPVYQTPNMPPVYQSPAAPPAEISVNMVPPVSAPQMQPNFDPAAYTPTVDVPEIAKPSEGSHVEHTSFQQKEPDQIIEIRSDATSISANTVSVESSQPLIPTLANFDPRKYFSPNETIAPKLDDVSEPKPELPAESNSMEYAPVRPNIPLPPIEDYRARPVALGQNSDVIVEQGPEDVQKVTQMFKELRRMRDK